MKKKDCFTDKKNWKQVSFKVI